MAVLVKIVDSTFHHTMSMAYAGENEHRYSVYVHWDRDPGEAAVKVWTDIRLKEAVGDNSLRKIALLIESPAVGTCYQEVLELEGVFDYVLTFHEDLVSRGMPYLFYPLGGSWIREWGMFSKTHMVSMLVSEKQLTEGHKIRHQAAQLSGIDCYGKGVGRRVASKAEALRRYRFAVIVENGQYNHYFSEKLIDCLSQGTIPIYRGCPDIGRFFDTRGIIQWSEIEELEEILANLTVEDYGQRIPWVVANLREARKYKCPEDWIVKHYPGLLKGEPC